MQEMDICKCLPCGFRFYFNWSDMGGADHLSSNRLFCMSKEVWELIKQTVFLKNGSAVISS